MSRTHSDAEMLLATQIAYLNIKPDGIGGPQNVADYLRSEKRILEAKLSSGVKDTQAEAQLNTINGIYEMTSRPEFRDIDWENWSVVDAWDHSSAGRLDQSGMYASLIKTGDGKAIIGFRGSESYDSTTKITDWAVSDLGLHNSMATPQQLDAEEYMRHIAENYGDEFEVFDCTGHSLGGNLAEHAVINAPAGMRDKIGGCINFDGPGFSEEYIAAHAHNINTMNDKVDHYAWSVVGSLLFPLPGTNYRIVAAGTPDDYDSDIINEAYRHHTRNLIIVDGHVIDGERDPLAASTDKLIKAYELADIKSLPLFMRLLMIERTAGVFLLTYEARKSLLGFTGTEAEFTVNTDGLCYAADELDVISADLGAVSAEIRDIAESLNYFSASGFIVKNKLRAMARRVEGDSSAAHRLGTAAGECAAEYINTDSLAGRCLTM